MKLPNNENAFIPKDKIKDYLLSENHPTGRSKSKFFRTFGFDETNFKILEQFLIKIAQTFEVTSEEISSHGKKYVIDGILSTPIGRDVSIRTIWIVEDIEAFPRFVTAYPIKS
jgi:hypothetical protein